jgi:hypothetical protein
MSSLLLFLVFRSRDFQHRGNQFCILKGNDSDAQNTMYQVLPNNYNLTLEFFYVRP